jgi:tRNA G18 (ribose-2'-O)-methylase SpoU
MTQAPITLVGDGIENPWNAGVLQAASAMFGATCAFRDRAGLAAAWSAARPDAEPLTMLTREELAAAYAPIIALDNVAGAQPVYGFRPRGPRPALVAGNERRGISREVLALSLRSVTIPMAGHRLDTLNVAAASAVALYYLSRGGGGPLQVTAQPPKRRPELLLLGAADHVELGSTIRSAGAFGWERVLVEDRAGVWFGAPRHVTTEGRSAARRHRNPIRLIPAAPTASYAFAEAWIVTRWRGEVPLHHAHLAAGPRGLLVIPDESAIDFEAEPWQRLAARVRYARLDLPERPFPYHYRLIASIVLAEAARQIGQRAREPVRRPRAEPLYDRALTLREAEQGETIDLEDLAGY